jgi:hypothetical protein
MSYILDALQKADRDRRTTRLPTIGTVHDAEPRTVHRWPWITALALLVTALAVSGVIVVRRQASAPETVATAPTATASTPAQPPATPQPGAPVIASSPAATPGASTPAAAAQTPASAAPVTTPPSAAPPQAAAPAAAAPATPPAPATAVPAPARQVPEPRREVPARRTEAAALKLEVLIYSDIPAERVAYINGQRYVEGQSVEGRALVEQIARDGVILTAGGKRYLLRQQQP